MSRSRGDRRRGAQAPTASPAVRRLAARFAWPVLFTALFVGVVAMGLVPTRTYLEKQQQIATAEARLAVLSESNREAQAHVDALQTDAEIERMAREQYGYVKPGEETYHVLPPPQAPVRIPDTWPFNQLRDGLPAGGPGR